MKERHGKTQILPVPPDAFADGDDVPLRLHLAAIALVA
jgi:hypothetical protein